METIVNLLKSLHLTDNSSKNYMLKKLLVLLVFVMIAVLCYVFLGHSDSTYFKRIHLITNVENIDKDIHLEKESSGNYLHVNSENVTLKTNIFRINGQKKIIVNTSMKGELKIYFNIKKLSGGSLKLKVINLNNNDIIKTITDFTHIITIKGSFSNKDKTQILIRFIGKADIAISDPLIYKRWTKKKDNYIFLISADTLRADHLGPYGYSKKITPNIDSFSKDTVIFERCFANSSWTLPSHMTLFTGMDVHTLGIFQ